MRVFHFFRLFPIPWFYALLLLSATQVQGDSRRDSPAPRVGPQAECRIEDGRIFGPWRHSTRPLVAYYTGPHAQRHEGFIEVAQRVATLLGGRYQEIHKEDVLPSADDENGALLYPDGAPRVALLLMPGGNSAYSMADLAGISDPLNPKAMVAERAKFEQMRKNPQAAFQAGMNYAGVCGGFFVATSGYTVPGALHTGWGLWPGRVKNVGPGQRPPFPDVVFDANAFAHPLVRAAGGRLREMYYNGGPIGVEENVADTEYLGRYHGGNMPELANDWFLVSYKPADRPMSGRCVIATGHPEVRHRDFLAAMALYAVDHEIEIPCRPLKPGDSVEATLGDDQLHFYRLAPPRGARVRLVLAGLSDACDLYVRRGLPPTPRRHDYKAVAPGKDPKQLVFFAPDTGPYFIAVHGAHNRLNGVRYTLAVGSP